MLAASASASAQDTAAPPSEVAAIRQLIFDARYDEAIGAARRLLERTDLTAALRNAGLEALATVYVARRDQAQATETLGRLYARDPEHRLSDPDASPVVRSAFERVRAAPPPPLAVRLAHDPPGRDDVLVVRVEEGADAVQELRLSYRHPGETEWATVVMTGDAAGARRARLPRAGGGGRDVEWFVEATAPSGYRLASLGSASEPLTLELAARADRVLGSPTAPARGPGRSTGGSVLTRWWFWTLVGVIVVGGAVAVGVGASGGGTEPAPTGTLGQRRLQ